MSTAVREAIKYSSVSSIWSSLMETLKHCRALSGVSENSVEIFSKSSSTTMDKEFHSMYVVI